MCSYLIKLLLLDPDRAILLKTNAFAPNKDSQTSTCPAPQTEARRTFLLVQRGQDAVVPAHLEVNLLLHTLGDGALGNDDADARLNGAQDASVAVEDPPSSGHHSVPFVFVVVLQSAGAEKRRRRRGRRQSNKVGMKKTSLRG